MKNYFSSKEFAETIFDQVNAYQKMQTEAYKAGYAKGYLDGQKSQTLEDLSNEQKAEQHEDERFTERAERDAELEKFN